MWNDPELRTLFLSETPLIDVRAPIEFIQGEIPHSVNLPIMNDLEREAVGKMYKDQGQEAAIKLGHELVNDEVKAKRVKLWKEFLEKNPQAEVFCFRGGLRSQISCQWISEAGFKKSPIKGGYKRLRNFFLSILNEAPLPHFHRISGLTGSGKTRLLLKTKNYIDLEARAHHRGSAFGLVSPQPAQITFENLLALDLLKSEGPVVIEDESAMLGKLTVPKRIFDHLRESPIILLETSLEERTKNIFEDFVLQGNEAKILQDLSKLERRLGKKRIERLKEEIQGAFKQKPDLKSHESWIQELLVEYYDPVYQKDLRINQKKIIFRGSEEDILAYLKGS